MIFFGHFDIAFKTICSTTGGLFGEFEPMGIFTLGIDLPSTTICSVDQ